MGSELGDSDDDDSGAVDEEAVVSGCVAGEEGDGATSVLSTTGAAEVDSSSLTSLADTEASEAAMVEGYAKNCHKFSSRHPLDPLALTLLAKRRIISRRAVLRLVVRADVRVAGDAGVVRETFRAARHAVGAGFL